MRDVNQQGTTGGKLIMSTVLEADSKYLLSIKKSEEGQKKKKKINRTKQ